MQAVIGDDAFHTQSPVAANVLSAAEKLEKWLVRPENCPSAEEFLSLLLSSLKACVPCNVTSTKSREMWSSYHQLRCSDAYISRWQCFLKRSLGEKGWYIIYYGVPFVSKLFIWEWVVITTGRAMASIIPTRFLFAPTRSAEKSTRFLSCIDSVR